MLAGISHDPRTPLARLRLEIKMSSSDQATKDAMVDDIEQMDRIIAAFSDYARPKQARLLEPVDLSLVAHDVAARLANEEGVQIRTVLAPAAVIEADETNMRRVIGNLVENARKYGLSSGDGIARITVETRASHARIEVIVRDEGPGIPDDQLPLVMRPFYRVDAARSKADGTGLGMAIVLRIVGCYRGTLRLRNRVPEPGLEASINFPTGKGSRGGLSARVDTMAGASVQAIENIIKIVNYYLNCHSIDLLR